MGAGASAIAAAPAADIKASVAAASADDLKATLEVLSDNEKSKLVEALSNGTKTAATVTPSAPEADRAELDEAELEEAAALIQAAVLSTAPAASTAPSPAVVIPEMAKQLDLRRIHSTNLATFSSWLDQTREQALEPDLEIVDPHHHLWDMRDLKGFNLFGMFRAAPYYLTDELVDDMIGGGHRVTHSVFVTTHAFFTADAEPAWMAPLGEVQFVQGVAAQFASGKYGPLRAAAAIIGAADLDKYGAELEPLLVACKAASPSYRGIRCTAAHDAKAAKGNFAAPGMYAETKFREGFALLHKHDLVFDAWVYASQLGDVVDLAKAFPQTTIVLNHAGTPLAALGNVADAPAYDGCQAQIVANWKAAMQRVADECPNVYVKVGAWTIPQLGHGLQERAAPPSSAEVATLFKDFYLWTISTFGAARCMLEGNFPVDKCAMSYTVLWNAYKRMTAEAGLSVADRALLFSGTAKRVYRIGA